MSDSPAINEDQNHDSAEIKPCAVASPRSPGWFARNRGETLAWLALVISIWAVVETRRQASLAERQFSHQLHVEHRALSGNQIWLREAIQDLLAAHPHMGYAALAALPREERRGWVSKVQNILKSEQENPVLLENTEALLKWRDAQGHIRNMDNAFDALDQNSFEWIASLAIHDVLDVWIIISRGPDEAGRLPKER